MNTPDLPSLPDPVKNGWMDCEDCDGRGAVGEPIYQGEFQPPECEPCSSCNGSGRWKVPLVTTQQAQAYGDARAAAAVLAERERVVKGISDHIERQLHAWRQSFMNKSGDRLALDDFMGEESINDLVDFVCDQWALDAAIRAEPKKEQQT